MGVTLVRRRHDAVAVPASMGPILSNGCDGHAPGLAHLGFQASMGPILSNGCDGAANRELEETASRFNGAHPLEWV